jgi:type II secretory pathway component GspD/PulD (secretin)
MKFLGIIIIFAVICIVPVQLFSQNTSNQEGSQAQSVPQQASSQTQGSSSAQGSSAQSSSTQAEKKITEETPLIDVKRLESEDSLYSIELRSANLADFFRLVAHDYDFNILVDKRITGTVTASFTNIPMEDALNNIAEMCGLLLEKKGKIITVKPNLVTKAIVLEHINALAFLSGNAETSSATMQTTTSSGTTLSSVGASTAPGAKGERGSLGTIYDLMSSLGKVFLGKQRNMIVVIDYPENVKKVEEFVKAVDGRMGTKVFKLKYISSKDIATKVEKEKPEFVLTGAGSGSSSGSSSSGSSQ